MKGVFLSYRRADSADVTGRIFDQLRATLGEENLFKDVESIPLGEDFRKAIANAVGQCKVLLAVIGQDWLEAADGTGKRRIDDPDDYVHLEIATALKRGIPVIPVLVENTLMPKQSDLPPALRELVFRNATPVRADPDFRPDMERLCAQTAPYIEAKPPRRILRWPLPMAKSIALAAGVAVLLVGIVIFALRRPSVTPDSELLGKWEQFIWDGGQWHSLSVLDVARIERKLEIRVVIQDFNNPGHRALSIKHQEFDGKQWRFSALFRDGVHGYFRFNRVSDNIFDGTLTTDNNQPESKQRLIKRE